MPEKREERRQEAPLLPMGPGRRFGPVGPGPKPKNMWSTLRRLWGFLRRQRFELLAVLLLVLVTTGLNLVNPYLLGQAIDRAIIHGDLPLLVRFSLLMVGFYLASSLSMGVQSYIMARVAQHTVRDLRQDLFSRMQILPLRYFDKTPHGDLMSRLTNDIDNISNVLSEGLTQFISSILTLVGVIAIMLLLNPWLALVSLVSVPLMTVITRSISRFTLKGFRDQQKALGAMNGTIEETITGERVIKAFGQERAAIQKFKVENQVLKEASIRAQTFSGMLGPLNNLVGNTAYAIVAGTGGWMALRGIATVGQIASFLNYSRQLGMPLNQIANLYNTIQSALAGAERVFETLDEPSEPADVPGADPLDAVRGDVVFDQVTFGYDEDQTVLEQVSLHARPGQTIALVGPTGAGKTTIINLLSRFYDVRAGSIHIDSTDIRGAQRDSLRRVLGIVLQDSFLFSDTVLQNIRYGRLDASDDDVITAARLANADTFIRHLPHGYQTMLSERGSNLSQGQRQMISIARAVLADPRILILDEATSSVDTRTETHIQEAMLRLMQGRTSFVIAHRLSTIREADEILVIDQGRIIERGTHSDLLAQKGFYQRLYASQFRGAGAGKLIRQALSIDPGIKGYNKGRRARVEDQKKSAITVNNAKKLVGPPGPRRPGAGAGGDHVIQYLGVFLKIAKQFSKNSPKHYIRRIGMKAENIIGPGSIVEKPERSYLGIRFETPFNGMFALVMKALKELRKWSNANGLSDEGPYFLRYYHTDMKGVMEVEVGLMTNSGLVGQGRIQPGSLPKGKYASLVYRGNGLRGNIALMKWAADHAIRFDRPAAGDAESYICRYEAYLTDYRIEPRKLLWDVELSIKIAED